MTTITENQLRDIIRQITRSDSVYNWPADFNFREREIDSLDHATLGLALEEKCNLKIKDDELDELTSISTIIAFLDRRHS
jgi:acyl carrier protein